MRTIGVLVAGWEFGIVYADCCIRHGGAVGTGRCDTVLIGAGLLILALVAAGR